MGCKPDEVVFLTHYLLGGLKQEQTNIRVHTRLAWTSNSSASGWTVFNILSNSSHETCELEINEVTSPKVMHAMQLVKAITRTQMLIFATSFFHSTAKHTNQSFRTSLYIDSIGPL